MKQALLLFFCFVSIAAAQAQSSALEAYWDDGLKFQSKDSLYRLSVGGRVHYDVAISDHSSAFNERFKDVSTNVGVRRARLSFEGTLNNAFAYEFEFSFGEDIEFADLFFAFLKVPFLERLTIGHIREPFGLEENTSSNAIVLMERSLPGAFAPGRNTGVMVQKQFFQEKLRGYAGIFRITNDLGSDTSSQAEHSFSSRWVLTPLSNKDNKVLHLGVAYNRFAPDGVSYKVSSSNEVDTNPEYVSTDDLKGVERVQQIGGEAAYGTGRFTLQSEWVHSFTRFANTSDLNAPSGTHQYKSFYVMGSYFLKRGLRRYSSNGNRFASIKVTRNNSPGSLNGAWEAGLRFSRLDLSDAGQDIHTINNVTAGLNWYYNSNTRIMMNYVHSQFNGGFTANTLQFRVQATF